MSGYAHFDIDIKIKKRYTDDKVSASVRMGTNEKELTAQQLLNELIEKGI